MSKDKQEGAKRADRTDCGLCGDRFAKRRAAECLACGKRLMLCQVCWPLFRGCGPSCIQQSRQKLKGILSEKIKSPFQKKAIEDH